MSRLVDKIRMDLEPCRDPKREAWQFAYMKEKFPFLGVPKPIQSKVCKEIFKTHSLKDWEGEVRQLWGCAEREFHYAAIDLALFYKKQWRSEHLPLFEWMIRENSWWDSVDEIAAHLIGGLLLRETALTEQADRWIDDPNMWIRRTAIIFQLNWKEKTDGSRLFRYCIKRAEEKEFFIRKAIGWALRQYGKVESKAVSDFAHLNRNILSNLSFKEATRSLPAIP